MNRNLLQKATMKSGRYFFLFVMLLFKIKFISHVFIKPLKLSYDNNIISGHRAFEFGLVRNVYYYFKR